MFAFLSNTSLVSLVRQSDHGRINDRLVEVISQFSNALSQLVNVSNILSVYYLLHYTHIL